MKDRRTRWRMVAATTAAVLAVTTTACADDDDTAVERAEEANIDPLVLGDEATITGELTGVVSPNAFQVNDTLVLAPTPELVSLFDPITEGDEVAVTGTIRELVIVDLEDEFGVDFDDDAIADWESDLILVASNVQSAFDSVEDAGDVLEEEAEDALGEEAPVDDDELVVGATITVTGQVEEAIGPNAFRLDSGGTPVLSADTDALQLLQEEREVVVTGTVAEFIVVEIEDELGIDLDDEVELELEDELVIIADNVEPVP